MDEDYSQYTDLLDAAIPKSKLIEFINSFPDDTAFYGYEGEMFGIVAIGPTDEKGLRKELGYITNDGQIVRLRY